MAAPRRVPEDQVKAAVSRHGYFTPDLNRTERRCRLQAIAADLGLSERRLRPLLQRLANGEPLYRARRDVGSVRALSPDVLNSLQRSCVSPSCKSWSDTQLTEFLQHEHPGERIACTTVRRAKRLFLASLPQAVLTPRQIEVAEVNQRWELDLSKMDAFVADPSHNNGIPFRPQLIIVEDARTRCCMFAGYFATGKAVDLATVMYGAIVPQSPEWPQCGVPREVAVDWAKAFRSDLFTNACGLLGISINSGYPHYPEGKGKVERLIGSVHHMFENTLAGNCTSDNRGPDAIDPQRFFTLVGWQWFDPRFRRPLLTLEQANAQLRDWVVGSYHRRTHSALGNTPMAAWLTCTRALRDPIAIPEPGFLEQCFLKQTERKIRRGQIEFGKRFFWHEALRDYDGATVQVRYAEGDLSRVFVYRASWRVCEALALPVFVQQADGTVNDQALWDRIQAANRLSAQDRRMRVAEIIEAAGTIPDAATIFAQRAAEAAIPLVQPPVELAVWPPRDEHADELDEAVLGVIGPRKKRAAAAADEENDDMVDARERGAA